MLQPMFVHIQKWDGGGTRHGLQEEDITGISSDTTSTTTYIYMLKWRRRMLGSLFITLILCVIGTWCYEVYVTDRSLADVCTTENNCKGKKNSDKEVNAEIEKFVSRNTQDSNIQQPMTGEDEKHSPQVVNPQIRQIHQTTTSKTSKDKSAVKTEDSTYFPTLPKILWWDFYSGDNVGKNENITCKAGVKCHAVSDRVFTDHRDTMAIIHYGSNFNFMDLPKERQPKMIWGLIHEESLKNADYIFNHEDILSLFNYTATFKRESDYPVTTHFLPNLDYLRSKKYLVSVADKNRYRQEEKLAPIFYIQSDCNVPSNRDKYVELLQKYIPVDSYGKCNNNKNLSEHLKFGNSMAPMNHKDFFALGAKYKFTLSMENAVCDDYITEKLWRPFHLGSVPIIFGSPKIKDFLPSNKSAILINDFDDIKDLAELVKYLDENDKEYGKYLLFKEKGGITNTFLINEVDNREFSKYDDMKRPHWSFFSGFECYICEEVHKNIAKMKSGENISEKVAQAEHYGCPPPKEFNVKGQYVVENKRHSFYWYEGKYRAKAFRHFYDNKIKFTEDDINKLTNVFRKEYKGNR